jgi:hypothetical protein
LAVQYRVPSRVVGRMVFNVAVDAAVGGVLLLGDMFDFVWKATQEACNCAFGQSQRDA